MIFTNPKHNAGLGYLHTFFLSMLKNSQALSKCCSSIPNIWGHLFDGFNVVSIDVQPRLGNKWNMFQGAGEISGQSFDQNMRSLKVKAQLVNNRCLDEHTISINAGKDNIS